nr:hypothetical protein CFP56_25762 [Quercus suber]
MYEALCSVLCKQGTWIYDVHDFKYITFKEDGTGELFYITGFSFFVAATHKWKTVPLSKEQKDSVERQRKVRPQLLGILSLEITLERTLPNGFSVPPSAPAYVNPSERYLSAAAFQQPRLFTAMMEKGNFLSEHLVGYDRAETSRWEYRLLFDVSPYPTRAGFKQHADSESCGPDLDVLAEELRVMTILTAGVLPKVAKRSRATNDDSIMGFRSTGCIVC